MPTKQIAPKDYLSLPASELLDKYGEGHHIPGSGSAAALAGLLAVELLSTVCKLTIQKDAYLNVHEEFKFMLDRLETEFKPTLKKYFVDDIEVFDKVSKLRRKRDEIEDLKEREKLAREATSELRGATTIPIEICQSCIEITKLAFVIFDRGFKSARGDSGVAISNLLSAISGSLFVTLLNLKTGRESKWSSELRKIAENLWKDYYKIHKDALSRVVTLHSEGLTDSQPEFKFEG